MLRLLSAVLSQPSSPELSLLPPWIFQQVNKTTGYLNALYQPWAVLKLFDFPAVELGLLVCFQKNKENETPSGPTSSRFSFMFLQNLCMSESEEREIGGFADSPQSSNSTSHPPNHLTATLVLSLHTPYWWGFLCQSKGSFLYSCFPPSLHPDISQSCQLCLQRSGGCSLTLGPVTGSLSDPVCPPHQTLLAPLKIQTPAAPSAAYVIPFE